MEYVLITDLENKNIAILAKDSAKIYYKGLNWIKKIIDFRYKQLKIADKNLLGKLLEGTWSLRSDLRISGKLKIKGGGEEVFVDLIKRYKGI